MVDTVVVSRPGHETGTGHVSEEVRARVRDLRGAGREQIERALAARGGPGIFFSDAVRMEVSSTEVRRALRGSRGGAADGLPLAPAVIEYIRKYGLYTDNA
jgi:nicotinic acid mononucleotide adenylyltransferase